MVDAAMWNSNALPVELRLVKETARRFAEESLRPLALQRRTLTVLPEPTRRAFDELGLGLAHVPREVGGVGLGPIAACLAGEALAAGDVNAAFALPQPGPFVDLVALAGNRHQRKIWLHPFLQAAERTYGAFAVAPRGALQARPVDGQHVLQGAVSGVWGATQAERVAVVADEVDGGGALTGRRLAAVLERETAGLHVGAPLTLGGLPLAQAAPMTFNAVRVAKSQWLSRDGLPAALDHVLCSQALRMASYALGAARAASAYVLDYAERRRREGRALAHYQSMAFLLVDMHLAVETAITRLREVTSRAAQAHLGCVAAADDAAAARPLPALAVGLVDALYKVRAEADEVAFFVTDSALQILHDEPDAQAEAAAHPVAGWHDDVGLLARSYPRAAQAHEGPDEPAPWLC